METKKHAGRAPGRQVGPDFPKPVSHGAAQRHSYRPPPLRPQEVFSHRLTLGFRQYLQPLAYRLAPPAVRKKMSGIFRGLPAIMHLTERIVHYKVHVGKPVHLRIA